MAASSSGASLPLVVFVVFLILKLTDVIDWSWWWVTSPLWISLIIGVLFLIPLGIFWGWLNKRN